MSHHTEFGTLHCSPTNDQEELFDQIAEGRYEFTSPYWDEVSESATVSADVSTVTPFIFFFTTEYRNPSRLGTVYA